MKNTIKVMLMALCMIICLSGCEDNNNAISDTEIEWISGGTTTTYTYSGGVISGYYFQRSFKVMNKPGDVTIDIQVMNDDNTIVSDTFSVEFGKQYTIRVKGSKSGSQLSSPVSDCLTVVFSSPNSNKNQEIKVSSYLVSSGGTDYYYCPKTLIFGEISIID